MLFEECCITRDDGLSFFNPIENIRHTRFQQFPRHVIMHDTRNVLLLTVNQLLSKLPYSGGIYIRVKLKI